jgi:hypothetical protein
MSGSCRKPGPPGPFVEGYRAWLIGRDYVPSVVIRSLLTMLTPERPADARSPPTQPALTSHDASRHS